MLYTSLKYLHVLGAAAWFGGAIAVSVLAAQAGRDGDPLIASAVRRQIERLGGRIFGPAAAATLLAGIATAVAGDVTMASLWVVWGYAGVLATAIVGGGVMRRTGLRLAAAADGGDTTGAAALGRRMGRLSVLNLVILASTIWAMVAKPTL